MKISIQKENHGLLKGLCTLGLALGISACGSAPAPAVPPVTQAAGTPMLGYPGMPGMMTGQYAGLTPYTSALAPYGAMPIPVAGAMNGCYPLTAPIPFTAMGAQVDSNVIKAGIIPAVADPWPNDLPSGWMPTPFGKAYGTVVYGGAVANPITTPTMNMFGGNIPVSGRSQADGSIQMNVNPMAIGNPMAAAFGGPAALSGTIIVSPAKVQAITAVAGGSTMGLYGFSGLPGTTALPGLRSPCVSAIAISMSYAGAGSSFQFNGGRVFLYLNGLPHGVYLQL